MMTLNVLLSLILQAKIVGKGKLGNGRILVKLLQVVSDNGSTKCSPEWNILRKFSDEQVKAYAYQRVDKLIVRFLPEGKHYPYDKFSFNEFENNFGESQLLSMRKALDEILDESKINSLVYSLLELIRDDDEVDFVHYGGRYIHKEQLFGSYAHPKRICIEALLLGLLYHAHNDPVQESSGRIELLEVPDRIRFVVERYKNENSLDLDRVVGLAESIVHNSKRPYAFEKKFPEKNLYDLEVYCNGTQIVELPKTGNLFIYGSGGSGKSTLLRSFILSEKTVPLYLPLYKYNGDIAVQLLLKYYYQYEYQNYNEAAANEGADEIIRSLTKLKILMKSPPIGGVQKYTLLLDGLNELSPEFQEKLINELDTISNEWKNVRIIVSGRNIPRYDFFSSFIKIEVCGISDNECDSVISKNGIILQNKKLSEILKNPLFLNMYLENNKCSFSVNSRGEILDFYVENNLVINSDNPIIRFAVRYALPVAARKMVSQHSFEVTRADLSDSINEAYECFIDNERVFQNYIAHKNFDRNSLSKSREETDIVEVLIINTGLLQVDISQPYKLCFVHQYFRDYFAARCIIDLLEAIDVSFDSSHLSEQEVFFRKYHLDDIWFGIDNDDIYELIGDICGDHKNIPDNDHFYSRTVLDSVLDMSREFDTFRAVENVLRTMNISRKGLICGVDLSRIPITGFIPCNAKFSLNGEYPSDFSGAYIHGIGVFNTDIQCAAYSIDESLLIAAFENGYTVLWNIAERRIVRDFDLSEYTSFGIEFEYAEIIENTARLVSMRSEVVIDLSIGEIIAFNFGPQYFDVSTVSIDDELVKEIRSQLPHFKNCDFSGASFLFDEDIEFLKTTGAIIE